MPTVPQAEERIAPAPTPGVRVDGGATGATFGLSEEQQTANKVRSDIIAERQRSADELAVAKADRYMADLEAELDTRAKQARGDGAVEAEQAALSDYDKASGEAKKHLASGEQMRAFEGHAANRRASLYSSLEVHVAGERAKFDQDTTQARIEADVNTAGKNFHNEALVEKSIGQARETWSDFGRRNNMPAEKVEVEGQKIESSARKDVIFGFISGDQPGKAREFYNKHKDHILPGDRLDIEAKLDSADRRSESYAHADKIRDQFVGKYLADKAHGGRPRPPVMDDAREELTAITDPDVRRETESILVQEFSRFQEKTEADERKRFEEAYAIVLETADTKAVNSVLWGALAPDEKDKLMSLAATLNRREDIKTDTSAYDFLEKMAADQPDVFLKISIPRNFGRLLSREDTKHFIDRQTGVKNNDEKTRKALADYKFDRALIVDQLKHFDIGTDPKKAERDRGVLGDVMAEIRANVQKTQSGPNARLATDSDIQGWVDSICMRKSVKHPERLWITLTPKERAAEIDMPGSKWDWSPFWDRSGQGSDEFKGIMQIKPQTRQILMDRLADLGRTRNLAVPASRYEYNMLSAYKIYLGGGSEADIEKALYEGATEIRRARPAGAQ